MDIILERILSLIPKKENGDFVHGAKKAFAESLKMPHNLVTMWINGSSKSYTKKLHEISTIYNVSVEWLKGETDEKKPTAESGELDIERRNWLNLYDKASAEQIEQIINYAKFLMSKENQENK